MLAWFGILALGYIVARAFGYIGGLVAMATAKAVVSAVKVTAFTVKGLILGLALPWIVLLETAVHDGSYRVQRVGPYKVS